MSREAVVLQTIQPVVTTMAEAALAASGGVAVQVWLLGPGDVCESCPHRSDCPDRTSCLHLAASEGARGPEGAPSPRLPLGTGPVGRIPRTGESLTARADLAALGVAEAAWLKKAGVKHVAALPLEHGRRVLGVLVVFCKSSPSETQLRSLGGAVRLGAEAIGNVEAYRSLAAERNRLAARNARLRSGLGLPEEAEPAPAPPLAPTQARRAAAAAAPPPPAPPERPDRNAAEIPAATGSMLHSERFTLPPLRSFAQIQREGILHALERTGWRVSGLQGAARALGLKPTTLESKMKRLGIRRPPR